MHFGSSTATVGVVSRSELVLVIAVEILASMNRHAARWDGHGESKTVRSGRK